MVRSNPSGNSRTGHSKLGSNSACLDCAFATSEGESVARYSIAARIALGWLSLNAKCVSSAKPGLGGAEHGFEHRQRLAQPAPRSAPTPVRGSHRGSLARSQPTSPLDPRGASRPAAPGTTGHGSRYPMVAKVGGGTADLKGTIVPIGSQSIFKISDGGGLFMTINDEIGGFDDNADDIIVYVAIQLTPAAGALVADPRPRESTTPRRSRGRARDPRLPSSA